MDKHDPHSGFGEGSASAVDVNGEVVVVYSLDRLPKSRPQAVVGHVFAFLAILGFSVPIALVVRMVSYRAASVHPLYLIVAIGVVLGVVRGAIGILRQRRRPGQEWATSQPVPESARIVVCALRDTPLALDSIDANFFEPEVFPCRWLWSGARRSRFVARWSDLTFLLWTCVLVVIINSNRTAGLAAVAIFGLLLALRALAFPRYLRLSPGLLELLGGHLRSAQVRVLARIGLRDALILIRLDWLCVYVYPERRRSDDPVKLGLAGFDDPVRVVRAIVRAAVSPHVVPAPAEHELCG